MVLKHLSGASDDLKEPALHLILANVVNEISDQLVPIPLLDPIIDALVSDRRYKFLIP